MKWASPRSDAYTFRSASARVGLKCRHVIGEDNDSATEIMELSLTSQLRLCEHCLGCMVQF